MSENRRGERVRETRETRIAVSEGLSETIRGAGGSAATARSTGTSARMASGVAARMAHW